MAEKGLITKSTLTDIGNAIRSKNGLTTTYKPAEMAEAIKAISSGTVALPKMTFLYFESPMGDTTSLKMKAITLSDLDEEKTKWGALYEGLANTSNAVNSRTVDDYMIAAIIHNSDKLIMDETNVYSNDTFKALFSQVYNILTYVTGLESNTPLLVPSTKLSVYQSTSRNWINIVGSADNIIAYDA